MKIEMTCIGFLRLGILVCTWLPAAALFSIALPPSFPTLHVFETSAALVMSLEQPVPNGGLLMVEVLTSQIDAVASGDGTSGNRIIFFANVQSATWAVTAGSLTGRICSVTLLDCLPRTTGQLGLTFKLLGVSAPLYSAPASQVLNVISRGRLITVILTSRVQP